MVWVLARVALGNKGAIAAQIGGALFRVVPFEQGTKTRRRTKVGGRLGSRRTKPRSTTVQGDSWRCVCKQPDVVEAM